MLGDLLLFFVVQGAFAQLRYEPFWVSSVASLQSFGVNLNKFEQNYCLQDVS